MALRRGNVTMPNCLRSGHESGADATIVEALARPMSDRDREQPLLVIQARSESQRLPRKVLTDLCGRPLLEWLIERVRDARSVSGVVVATTTRPADDEIEELAGRIGVPVFRGSSDDVLGRFEALAAEAEPGSVIRICGDSPLLDSATVDTVVDAFQGSDAEIAQNHLGPGWPDGVSVEVMTRECLRRLDNEARDARSREHVTLYAYEHPDEYEVLHVPPPPSVAAPHLTLWVDTPEDLERVRGICDSFAPRHDFSLAELVEQVRAAEVG